jgi:hypothetical protein
MSVKTGLQNVVRQMSATRAAISTIRSYRKGQSIAHVDWEKILWAHCTTNGRFTDCLTPVLRRINPPRQAADAKGLLGCFTVTDQNQIVRQLAQDGYYIFDTLVPEHICAAIEEFARTCPAYMEDEFGTSERPVLYESGHPRARLYKLREQDSLANPAIQALMADDALIRISEAYLQTRAVVGGIDCWWSAPYGNGPSSQAAQLFHFDFDAPPRWLKLFVYVTPVGPENGPHVFVKGSHKSRVASAEELFSRGYERIPDDDIGRIYGNDAPIEITGPRGTVFLADTRGFHKGKHPTRDHRLICQLVYCSPVFNNHAGPPEHAVSFGAELAGAIEKNRAAYQRYL